MIETIFKIDLDLKLGKKQLQSFIETRRAIIESLGMKLLRYREDSSKRGHHLWFYCEGKNMNERQINFTQFLLGDDIGRCKINAARIRRGVRDWNVIFDHVIWRRPHSCNCSIHKKILKRQKEGQKAFRGI